MANYTGAARAAAAQNIQNSGPELPDFLKDDAAMEDAPATEEAAPAESSALTSPEQTRLEGIASEHGFDESQVADVVKVVEAFLGGAPMPEEAPEEAPEEEMA